MTVLVVGAGPTGLTAAVELARHGVPVRVIEKRPDPSPFSRAVGITRRSIDLLRPSGAADAILAEAQVFNAALLHSGARLAARVPLNFDDRSRIWALPQDRTEAHLAATLERLGGHVEYGTELLDFMQHDQGVTARLSTGEASVGTLVGADGVHSAVRHGLGLDFPGYEMPEDWSIADVTNPDWPHPDKFCGYLLPRGEVAVVVPLAHRRYRVVASEPDALAALPVPMRVTELHSAGRFRIHVRQAPQFAAGRVFLAGDAAHCHSPIGGRGMNLGIADAADLAARIVAGDTTGYHAARHSAAGRVIAMTERLRRILQGGPATRAVLLPLLAVLRLPPLARLLARRLADG